MVGSSPPLSVTIPPIVAESAAILLAATLATAGTAGNVVNDRLGDAIESPELLLAKAVKK
tara:strand:+ start:2827 stop:3006 length:180 start_codon:yes stop_codon:yes gene_type:complete